MANEKRLITSEEVLAELGARMEEDPAFVEQLGQDPKQILDALGIEVPDDVSVRLEPEPDGTCRLAAYRREGAELTDEELGEIAGGVAIPQFKPLALSRSLKLSAGTTAQVIIAYLAVGA